MRTPCAANLCKCQKRGTTKPSRRLISRSPSLANNLFKFNNLQEALVLNRDESAVRFEPQRICTKQFPQGFHSGEKPENLCKVFKKDPFSSGIVGV
jgi:hypothetical protein